MTNLPQRRLVATVITIVLIASIATIQSALQSSTDQQPTRQQVESSSQPLATTVLRTIAIKGRAPKTGYTRDQFGGDWKTINGCDTRDSILNRDLTSVTLDDKCHVTSGVLLDPYTAKTISFKRGSGTSSMIQIDHVVALSNAWQTGAQQLSQQQRVTLANDPLELLAVDGQANQQKSDGDAATWLPKNKAFRCQYIARQIAVKQKYALWMTRAEHDASAKILGTCPRQHLPEEH